MIHKIRHLIHGRQNRPLFVIGTGRSGTHWLGETLDTHPEIRATIEIEPIFSWSRDMAMNPAKQAEMMPKIIRAYKRQLFKSAPRLYLDKSHPNIWFAEGLQAAFPDALFLGIERNPFATVASMMKHKMVASWHKLWRQFPVPNQFLGIDEETAKIYETMPLAARCALRWVSHHRRMEELRGTLGRSLLFIQYESFAANTEREIAGLQSFLQLKQSIPVPDVKSESLDKWRTQLSQDEVKAISDVVGFAPEEMTAARR
jgi:hypothetical protein